MKRAIRYIVFGMLAFITVVRCDVAFGQVKFTSEEKNLKKEADYYFGYGDYLNALKIYKGLLKTHSLSGELNYKVGKSVLITQGNWEQAVDYFLIADKNGNKDASLYLGDWYLLQNDVEKSIAHYQSLETKKGYPNVDGISIQDRIASCKKASEMMNNPVDVTIDNMGETINSEHGDYVPVISADEELLMFTSRREGGTGGNLDPYGKYFEDIYVSIKNDMEWEAPIGLGELVNTDNHDACVGLSSDGTTLISYRTNEAYSGGDLYYSELEGVVWQKPIKFGPNINSEHLEPSASFTSDMRTLYFSSNRPGGIGDLDIYRVVKLPNGEWSLPQSLGEVINTKYSDDAPFIHPDGKTLYFSSKGHSTMGNYDIFKSDLNEDGTWSPPENLGYPINTTDDDIYFVLSADGKRGYFSSGRSGGFGGQDLYVALLPGKVKNLTIIKGIVSVADNNDRPTPISARITVRNAESKRIQGIYYSNSTTGKYLIVIPPNKKFSLIVEAEGYKTYKQNVFYEDDAGFNIIYKPLELVKAIK